MKRTKRALAALGVISTGLALVRVVVLFTESWVVVRSERNADHALLSLCAREEGVSTSSKFRNACLAARHDTAAPLLLKAMLRAFSTLFTDFVEAFSSPTKIVLLVMFVLSGLSAPLLKFALKTFAAGLKAGGGKEESDSEDEEDKRVLVLTAPSPVSRFDVRKHLKLTHRATPVLRAEVDEIDGFKINL